jgi:leader peptidase (prepilin peptidase)/N-methyltransferase
MSELTLIVVAMTAVVGLLVGSFVNVVVHRVPAGLSVVRPRSSCPACGGFVRERDNVPVVSWLLLRGRCRDCAVPIPVRYPAVEGGTAILFALVASRAPSLPELVALLAVTGAGVSLAFIDLEHGRLPFAVTAWAGGLALLSLASGWAWTAWSQGPAAVGAEAGPALGGAGTWLAVYGIVHLVTSGRGMGLGDVALAPVLGLVLGAVGTAESLTGLALGFLTGAVVGAALLTTRRAARRTAIPFGPFMLLGAALGLLVGPVLASTYLRLVGLA